jgi:hypothetical protein
MRRHACRRLASGPAFLVLISCLLLVLNACVLRGKNKVVATPAAPVPVAVVAPAPPAPPPEPVSTPQTGVQLPPPQPISAEALASIPPPPEPPAPEPVPSRSVRTRPPTRETPKPEAAAVGPESPPPAVADDGPRLQTMVPEDERRRISADLARRRAEVQSLLKQTRLHTAHQRDLRDSIHSLLKVADDAAERGDLRSADSLSERALILARELQSGR